MLASTCAVQLWAAGSVLAAILVPALHPSFWPDVVVQYRAWIIAILFVEFFHHGVSKFVDIFIAPGANLKKPFAWLFIYILFSTVLCVVCPLSSCSCAGVCQRRHLDQLGQLGES